MCRPSRRKRTTDLASASPVPTTVAQKGEKLSNRETEGEAEEETAGAKVAGAGARVDRQLQWYSHFINKFSLQGHIFLREAFYLRLCLSLNIETYR